MACLLCSQGLVQAVGVSNYGPKQLQRIHKHLTARGVPLASVQACHRSCSALSRCARDGQQCCCRLIPLAQRLQHDTACSALTLTASSSSQEAFWSQHTSLRSVQRMQPEPAGGFGADCI